MSEVLFLFVLALIWIVFATVQDFKTREVANWLSFSLIIFALGFRFFYSLFALGNFNFFYQGLLGLGVFFIIGNALYYGKLFAGGDAKLLIALGTILPGTGNFLSNFENYLVFLMIFLFVGAFYSILVSLYFCIKNYLGFKKEFKRQFLKNKRILVISLLLSIILVILGWINLYLLFLGILTFVLPYLYIYSKAVDEAAMVRYVDTRKIREGDWLYKDMGVKGRVIRVTWEGLKKEEIALLRRKYRKVQIRQGVAFTFVFLASLIIFIFWNKILRYSFW
jgi:Flp pilus assembly protein protease CpaA